MNGLPILAALILACSAGASVAQSYPGKAVRVVVPFTPGSGTDILARAVAPKLAEHWGQPVLVENRPGAGGVIGVGAVAKAPPDGYTLLWHSSAFASTAAVHDTLPYDPLRDFSAITALLNQPHALVVSPAAGARTIAELIAAAKARGRQITYGSAGAGTSTQFAAEKFRIAAGIEAVHVPYRGGPEVNGDVMAGRVTYWMSPLVMAVPNIREGKLVALGVTSAERSSLLPEVPAIAEAGLPGFNYTTWWGLWAPANTPTEVIEKISKDAARVLVTAELRERLAKLGAEPMIMPPSEFTRFVRSQIDEAKHIAKAAGIKPE